MKLSARAAEKEIKDVEGPRTANKREAENWLRHFKESDISLGEKPKSRRFSIVEDEAFL